MFETFSAIILGSILPVIIKKGKQLGVSAKLTYVLLAISLALPYVLVELYLPGDIKQNLYALFSQVVATSFLVYEFLLKKHLNK